MSSIREFYIDKEKRELINTINSAKYMNEEQKEVDRFFIKSHNSLKDAKDKFDLQYAEKVKNNPSLVKKKPTVSQYRLGVSATKKNEKIDSIRLNYS